MSENWFHHFIQWYIERQYIYYFPVGYIHLQQKTFPTFWYNNQQMDMISEENAAIWNMNGLISSLPCIVKLSARKS